MRFILSNIEASPEMYTFVVTKLTYKYHMERAPVPFTPAFYPAGSISFGVNPIDCTK